MITTSRKTYLSPAEIAAELRVTTGTVYRHIANGNLPAVKAGGSIRVERADLDNWLVSAEDAARRAAA
jgi:excisionase family DNA binding protein